MPGALAELHDEVAELRVALARAEAGAEARAAKAEAEAAAQRELVAELKAMLAMTRRPWWRRLID
jgi:regulator of protease activity HflC (stomatin/prohibitin superfamily)